MTRQNFKRRFKITSHIHGVGLYDTLSDFKKFRVPLSCFDQKHYVEYFNINYKSVRIVINNLGKRNENILHSSPDKTTVLIFCDIDPYNEWKNAYIPFEDFYDMEGSSDEGLENTFKKV